MKHTSCLAVMVTALGGLLLSGQDEVAPNARPLNMLAASYWTSAGDDALTACAFGPDGSIYLAGYTSAPPNLPEGSPRPTPIGAPVENTPYGHAFVARLDSEAKALKGLLLFAPGLARITSIAVAPNGEVYLGGYAGAGLAGHLGEGYLLAYPKPPDPLPTFTPKEHTEKSNPQVDASVAAAPFVLRCDAELAGVLNGTFLEGWHSRWRVPWPLLEIQEQPVDLAFFPNGDLLVSHDGGYLAEGLPAGLEAFYAAEDYLSRLTPDLRARVWKKVVRTPPVDPAKASQYLDPETAWTRAYLGNPRILRIAVEPVTPPPGQDPPPPDEERFYICGWSASRTSREPWWSCFMRAYDGHGEVRWRAFEHDPMGGGEDRMSGLVSDSAVACVNADEAGRVLLAVKGDGGNTVLRRHPRDYGQALGPELKGSLHGFRGRVLFWGGSYRLDAETGDFLNGQQWAGYEYGQVCAAWPTDLAALPAQRVFVVGRHNEGFRFSKQAEYAANRSGSFVAVCGPTFNVEYASAIPDTDLARCARWKNRLLVVGHARDPRRDWAHDFRWKKIRSDHAKRPEAQRPQPEPLPERRETPVVHALFPESLGQQDGYFVLLEYTSEPGP